MHLIRSLNRAIGQASQLVYGCMGLGGGWNDNALTKDDIHQAEQIIDTCLDHNITVFDHADIYTFNKAEKVFGQILKSRPGLREQMVLQSKCGIRFADEYGPKRYDFSAEWLTTSVQGILQRLNIDYLDILLLHRPDPLMELHETAQALNQMHAQGLFKAIGVSNMSVVQIEFLQSALGMPIIVNQVECGLHHLALLDQQVIGNDAQYPSYNTFSGMLEYSQTQGVQLQAWCALSQGRYSRPQTDVEHRVHKVLAECAQHHGVSIEAVQLAFLTRHPANIQPVIGTTNINRIRECSKLANIILSREEWYKLLQTARNAELP
jgi:predicted oxidoreductase